MFLMLLCLICSINICYAGEQKKVSEPPIATRTFAASCEKLSGQVHARPPLYAARGIDPNDGCLVSQFIAPHPHTIEHPTDDSIVESVALFHASNSLITKISPLWKDDIRKRTLIWSDPNIYLLGDHVAIQPHLFPPSKISILDIRLFTNEKQKQDFVRNLPQRLAFNASIDQLKPLLRDKKVQQALKDDAKAMKFDPQHDIPTEHDNETLRAIVQKALSIASHVPPSLIQSCLQASISQQ